eukprot:TRINITY_DN79458_c0_g1_i1.p4 TRINITY_DN79458_c0_g1~~TRINITY_DN79458_c0_g1_i1.p4  ORF type:complete len:101 (+),score=3.93 TRINITY_DN79458_c0_g1_i1:390-692(+)
MLVNVLDLVGSTRLLQCTARSNAAATHRNWWPTAMARVDVLKSMAALGGTWLPDGMNISELASLSSSQFGPHASSRLKSMTATDDLYVSDTYATKYLSLG